MIEIDPDAHLGVWGYAGLKIDITALFEDRVDVVDRDGLKPWIEPVAVADCIHAF